MKARRHCRRLRESAVDTKDSSVEALRKPTERSKAGLHRQLVGPPGHDRGYCGDVGLHYQRHAVSPLNAASPLPAYDALRAITTAGLTTSLTAIPTTGWRHRHHRHRLPVFAHELTDIFPYPAKLRSRQAPGELFELYTLPANFSQLHQIRLNSQASSPFRFRRSFPRLTPKCSGPMRRDTVRNGPNH